MRMTLSCVERAVTLSASLIGSGNFFGLARLLSFLGFADHPASELPSPLPDYPDLRLP